MRTPADIQTSFYAVLHTDAAGAAVRAQLEIYAPGAASRVIVREDLNRESLPAAPFLVLSWGVGGGTRTGMQRFLSAWWLYDDLPFRWGRINVLVPLIRAAYPKDALAFCEIDFTADSGEVTDAALQRRAKSLPVIILTR